MVQNNFVNIFRKFPRIFSKCSQFSSLKNIDSIDVFLIEIIDIFDIRTIVKLRIYEVSWWYS